MNTDFSLPEGTHTVILGLGDLNGIMRGKRIPASHWETICKQGNALSIAMFAIDSNCDVSGLSDHGRAIPGLSVTDDSDGFESIQLITCRMDFSPNFRHQQLLLETVPLRSGFNFYSLFGTAVAK